MSVDLTKEEAAAVASLKRLAKKWPESLWLFASNGTLCAMKKTEAGSRATTGLGAVDPDYVVATVDIECDGGDF